MEKQLFIHLLLSAVLLCTCCTLHAAIRYVKPAAAGTGDGSSWANASANLQAMINASGAGDEVWVAAGTYKPTAGTDRTIAFRMKNGVGIYGGFFGIETARDQRNFTDNVTILSGDLNDNDVISGSGSSLNISNNDENSSVVVSNDFPMDNPLTSSAILDGFTIMGGRNQESLIAPHNAGAGMRNHFASPTLRNMIIIGNEGFYGGGMFNSLNSSPVLTNVTFERNSSQRDGGGMHNYTNANVVLDNVTFTGNLSFGSFGGGAIANFDNSPTFNNCRFSDNFASVAGAMSNIGVDATFTNCSFTNNGVFQDAGGLFIERSTINFFNCLFSGNRATNFYAGAMYVKSATVNATNCVFWNNSAGSTNPYNQSGVMSIDGNNPSVTIKNSIIWSNQSLFLGVQPTITYSIVEGDYTGSGNLNADPLFVDPANPIGVDGAWGTADDGFRLQACSWAVNTGDNAGVTGADFAGGARIFNTTVDMGAYELQSVTPAGNTTFYRDQDGDSFGFGNAVITTSDYCAAVGYVANNTDCNDNNPFINPGSAEVCDGLDNNCNNQTDEGVQTTYYQDQDGDGFGNAAISTVVHCPPVGYVTDNTDCNDNNPDVNPGFAEVCDGLDNNCNGTVDEITANCAIAGTRTWTGALGADWNTPCNWSPACVPTAADDAVIPPATNQPIINATSAVAKSLHVQSGASLTISASGALTVNGSRSFDFAIAGIYNQGTVNNNGALTLGSTSSVGQLGLWNVATFNNNSGANIRIDRASSSGISNRGVFTNAASIIIGGGAGVSNFGIFNQATFNNTSCAEISMFARFYDDAGLFSNTGLIRCNTTATPHFNVIGLTNEGVIVYPRGNPIPNMTNNDLIVQPISGGCTIANALQLGGAVSFTVGTTWYLDENLTSTAGTYDQATNTFSPTNLPVGTPTTVYFSLTDNINACIRTVSIEVTFSSDITWHQDLDGDGFGNPAVSQVACRQPTGYVADNTDCDDNDPMQKPGQIWYADLDNDGYGTGVTQTQCLRPEGYKLATELMAAVDCNDNAAAIHPDAAEVCDGIDNNCDNQTDEGVQTTYYRDQDGDGFGNPSNTTQACSLPTGYVTNDQDCNDNNGAIKPGAAEVCGNGQDDNCNGQTDEGCCDLSISQVTAVGETCPNQGGGITVTATSSYGPINYAIAGPVNQSNSTGIFTNLPVGNYGITVTDGLNCSAQSTAQLASGVDNTPPEIICPATQTLVLGANCTATLPDYTNLATTDDNCGVQDVSQSPTAGATVFTLGNMTVTLTVRDVNGNVSTCMATVTVKDNTPPTLSCSGGSLFFNGQASLPVTDAVAAQASNACGAVSLSYTPQTISCQQVGQSVPVVVTATDGQGNVSRCTTAVQVGGLPCGFEDTGGIGCSSQASYNAASGVFSLQTNGCANANPSSDQHGFIAYQLCGNGSLSFRVAGISSTSAFAGIQLRTGPQTGAIKAELATNLYFTARKAVRGTPNTAAWPQQFFLTGQPWLRVERLNNQIRIYSSANGLSWNLAVVSNMSLPNCVYVGMFAYGPGVVTATFDDVVVNGTSLSVVSPLGGGFPLEEASPKPAAVHRLPFTVYPNPTSGQLTVQLPAELSLEDARLEVIDGYGRCLLRETQLDYRQQLDLHRLPAGTYLVRLQTADGERWLERVVVQP